MKNNFRQVLPFLLAPVFIFSVIHLHLHSRYLIYGDEAEYMNNAWRVFTGDKPYKDFWLLFPPAEVYFPAFVFHVVGVNLDIILLSNILVSLLVLLFVFLLLKELKCSPLYSLVAAFLFILHGYFLFFTLLCMASCYFLLRFVNTGKRALLFISGFIAGLALLLRIYQVAPFCIAGFCFLLMQKQNQKERLYNSLWFVGAAAIPVVITIAALFDIRADMFNALIIDAPSHGTSMNVPYFYKMMEAWNKMIAYINLSKTEPRAYPLKGLPIMASDFLFSFFERVVPFIVASCFINDLITRAVERNIIVRRAMFMIWGILYSPYAFNLSGHEHIIQAYVPLLILFYEYGYGIFARNKNPVLKLLFAGCFTIIILNSSVKIYNTYKFSYASPYVLKTATGRLYIDTKDRYDTMQGIVNDIYTNTAKGDNIFCLCWNTPPLYALTQRCDPSYYDSPIDLLIRPARWKEESIINTLARTKTRLVIVQTEFSIKDGIYAKNATPLLLDYIRNDYRMIKRYPLYEVYLLK